MRNHLLVILMLGTMIVVSSMSVLSNPTNRMLTHDLVSLLEEEQCIYLPEESTRYLSTILPSVNAGEQSPLQQLFATPLLMFPAAGPMDSAWPMSCHDLHHTGQSPYSTVGNPEYEEKWRAGTMGAFWDDGPVIDDNGTIYIGNFNGYLYAIFSNGTMKWSYRTGELIHSSPAIAEDGTIYVSSYDRYLYAFSPNGTVKWNRKVDNSITSSPAIDENGIIYFGTFGGRIYALNPNGTVQWYYTTGGDILSDPAIGDDGTIYIGSYDRHLYALNPNGTLKWRFQTGGIVKSHPSIATDGTIYFGSFDGNLYALNPNGTEKWRFNNPGSGANAASIAMDGTIYVAGDNMYALNPDGSLQWTFDLRSEWKLVAHSSPALSADGTIYVGVIQCTPNYGNYLWGELLVLHPNGTLFWRKTIGSYKVASSPCMAEDGTVYIGSYNDNKSGWSYGYLHAFGERQQPNQPPTTPVITGSEQTPVGYAEYMIVATDPEAQSLRYWIEWGDGSILPWDGPYPSGNEVIIKKNWGNQGTYTIRVQAEDECGEYSDWGSFVVKVPKNSNIFTNHPILSWLLERYPNLFPLLRNVINL